MEISTKNFNQNSDKKLSCTCGNASCDKRTVNQETLDKLQIVRDKIKREMIVTSGGRCPLHKEELHRARPADHQKCIGVDIFYDTEEFKNLLISYGAIAGFTAIAAGSNFVHLGNRPQNHISTWSYK